MIGSKPSRPIARADSRRGYNVDRPAAYRRDTMRTGIRDFIDQYNPTHALTLNSNREMSIDNIKRMFGTFCRKVDDDRFGRRRVLQLPSSFRFAAIALIEHAASHPHLHVAANLSPTWLGRFVDDEYIDRLASHWDGITKGAGSIKVDPLRDEAGWGRYITKSYRFGDNFILSNDFHSAESLLYSSEIDKVLEAIGP